MSGVKNYVFEFFSRITAIRKDSKNENSTHSSLLESEVLFLFSIVADNVIFATDTTKTKFWLKFFGRLFSKRGGTVAVLHNTAEKGEWKAADRAHPEP